jgi:hypothetical protein
VTLLSYGLIYKRQEWEEELIQFTLLLTHKICYVNNDIRDDPTIYGTQVVKAIKDKYFLMLSSTCLFALAKMVEEKSKQCFIHTK